VPTARLHDIDAYYETSGSGEPLVLLHGLGSSGRDWARQMTVFGDRYRIIAPDLRGCGRTAKPPGPYTIQRFADDLDTLLDRLEVASAHLLGYSLGGAVALQFANDYSARVRSLIVVNCQSCCVPSDWRVALDLYLRLGATRCLGVRAAGRLIARRLFPRPDQAGLRAMLAERYGANDKRAYLAALDALVDWSMDRWTHAIAAPTLIITPELPAASHAASAAAPRGMPNATVKRVSDRCQCTPFDPSGTFNRLVLEFLDSQRRPAVFVAWKKESPAG
jgi:pimeloyl-ACP methyl ester carboxylesterase